MPTPKMLWSEDFDSLDLATADNPNGLWRPNDVWQNLGEGYLDFGAGGNSSWNCVPTQSLGGTRFNPFSIQDSVLTIRTTRTPEAARSAAGDATWLTGFLVSNSAEITFGYGYYEFRVRLHQQRGGFPAVWLYNRQNGTQPAEHAGAEIDLFEVFGYASGYPWTTTLHSGANNGGDAIGDQSVAESYDDTAGWHTYGVHWTANRMDFYKDRRLVGSANQEFVSWFAGRQMDIRLNVAMDATWFADQNRSTPATIGVAMDIDFVHMYDIVPARGWQPSTEMTRARPATTSNPEHVAANTGRRLG